MHASPIGISGCGVWYIPNFTNPQGGLPDYQLMGFINEQNAEKTFLIATRIHILTEVLRKIFEVNIPKSNIISLNNKQTLVPSNT